MYRVPSKIYYVILTGSKNNAGDYLIKYRAKELFKSLRPDREVIDLDGWVEFDNKTLEIVNGAEALILMGGPALQKNIYPNIYPLRKNLDEIKTKISFMGIGWKSLNGSWEDTHNYPLTSKSKDLIKRVISDDLVNSVRDHHTLSVLRRYGLEAFMTGCPATYCLNKNTKNTYQNKIKKVGFSLGVSFLESKSLELQMKQAIQETVKLFNGADLKVVFHHSTNPEFLKTHNATKSHLFGHLNFIKWLNKNGIGYIDISGSAESLIDFYTDCDIHVGYRVHAHIFMSSISKPSYLIAEDGRGKALSKVIGGVVLDAFYSAKENLLGKLFRKVKFSDGFQVNEFLKDELMDNLRYELEHGFPMVKTSHKIIAENYKLMENYIENLP